MAIELSTEITAIIMIGNNKKVEIIAFCQFELCSARGELKYCLQYKIKVLKKMV
jgi:hypothetical protein